MKLEAAAKTGPADNKALFESKRKYNLLVCRYKELQTKFKARVALDSPRTPVPVAAGIYIYILASLLKSYLLIYTSSILHLFSSLRSSGVGCPSDYPSCPCRS